MVQLSNLSYQRTNVTTKNMQWLQSEFIGWRLLPGFARICLRRAPWLETNHSSRKSFLRTGTTPSKTKWTLSTSTCTVRPHAFPQGGSISRSTFLTSNMTKRPKRMLPPGFLLSKICKWRQEISRCRITMLNECRY